MGRSFTHAELVDIAYRWVLKNASCGFAFKELNAFTRSGEIPDVIGFGSGGHSVLIECKVSRSDFLADKKKTFRQHPSLGMGAHRLFCCPSGLISKEELPEGWGLIYVNEAGKAIKVHSIYKGSGDMHKTAQERCIQSEMALMYSALRRLHLRGRIDEIYQEIEEQREGKRKADKDYLDWLNAQREANKASVQRLITQNKKV